MTVSDVTIKNMGFKARVVVLSSVFLLLPPFAFASFDANLHQGSRGSMVTLLQQFLISQNLLPAGSASGFFGKLTQQAVIAFQHEQGIIPASGFVGPLTRSRMHAVQGGGAGSLSGIENQNAKNYYSNLYGKESSQTGGSVPGTGSSSGSWSASSPGGGTGATLPSCEGYGQLTAAPVDLDSFAYSIPLGNLNPIAGHVTPTDHMYISLRTQSGNPDDYNSPSIPADVKAPGDVTLMQIQSSEHLLNGVTTKDYRLAFSPCREILLFYDHIQTLSPAVQAVLDKAGGPANCGSSQQGNTGQKMCTYSVSAPLKSGDVVGTVGNGSSHSFDFGGYDLRAPALAFINQQRTLSGPGQYFHTICPFDYFSPGTLKASLFGRIKNTRKNSQGLPDCGTNMQDIPGTIQGNWYLQGSKFENGLQQFSEELAIVHSNTDPSMGVISIGGTIAKAESISFIPTDSGSLNREPSKVGADGGLYCYQDQYHPAEHFLLQLSDPATLKIEDQSGACPSVLTFSNPSLYVR